MLVDTSLVAILPQRGLTPDEAATTVLSESAFLGPVPILFLRSQHVSKYGHDLKPRIYRVRLHPIPCTKTTVCKEGDLLGPLDAEGTSHRASGVTYHGGIALLQVTSLSA